MAETGGLVRARTARGRGGRRTSSACARCGSRTSSATRSRSAGSSSCRVRTYEDDPRWEEPRWETIGARRGDAVLAVNFFGARAGTGWDEQRAAADWLLVEDHSARSVLALGGRLERRLRVQLAAEDAAGSRRRDPLVAARARPSAAAAWLGGGSELKLAAMLLKGRYLEGGGGEDLKERFRRLQLEGEEQLARSPVAAASPAAREAVIGGAPLPWRVRRSDNAVHLLGLIAGSGDRRAASSTSGPPAPRRSASCSRSGRRTCATACARLLREAGVYCPIHWRIERPASERVRDLSTRVLTIPTDWRYSDADMERVASILREAEPACDGRDARRRRRAVGRARRRGADARRLLPARVRARVRVGGRGPARRGADGGCAVPAAPARAALRRGRSRRDHALRLRRAPSARRRGRTPSRMCANFATGAQPRVS